VVNSLNCRRIVLDAEDMCGGAKAGSLFTAASQVLALLKHLVKSFLRVKWINIAALSTAIAPHTQAAEVGGSGYTNAFATQPLAADWATVSMPGAAADAYDMDSDVSANIILGGVTAPTSADAGNPPAANLNATWSSTGFNLQTRPMGSRYTVLMGKFVNNTGTNATQITLSYSLTVAAGGVAEESGKGLRVYYSLSGLAESWINLPALNSTASANGTIPMSATLARRPRRSIATATACRILGKASTDWIPSTRTTRRWTPTATA
jgi:hypothetical protein